MLNLIKAHTHVTSSRIENDPTNLDPTRLPLDELELRCLQESRRFQRSGRSDTSYGYELCRRALTLHSEQAWSVLMTVYRRLVGHWVLAHPSYIHSEEETDYFVNRAFERLWRNVALKPGKFAKFESLPSILSFLRLCVHSAVIDDVPKTVPTSDAPLSDFEEVLIDPLSSQLNDHFKSDFWKLVHSHLNSEAERIVIVAYFFYDMKNREVMAAYPDQFQDTKQMSNLRLNVLRRLARVPAFEQTLRAFIEQEDNFRFGRSLVC